MQKLILLFSMATYNSTVAKMLDRFRENYLELKGSPFEHFFCPILFKDEDTELCDAHIVNKRFKGVSRRGTVQRKDVDGFYGSHFEADFQVIETARLKTPIEIISDKSLSKRLNAKIFLGEDKIDHFFPTGSVPSHYTPIIIDGSQTQFGLKIHPQEFREMDGLQGAVEFQRDVRVQMIASLIKSAHLTMFELLMYDYALAATGEFVGHQILGRFYSENDGKDRAEVEANSLEYFREFGAMVRPLIQCSFDARGTIEDQTLFCCVGSSGAIWGMIVLVRTGAMVHGVMLPVFDHPERVSTFFDFLQNENENIHVSPCRFNSELARWEVAKETRPMVWPKKGVLYPEAA